MPEILIVEDEIVVALGIRKILENNGYTISGIATKYKKAKELILSTPCDLILCDINLRDKYSGIKLMQEIRNEVSTPFMFVTAYSDAETIAEALSINPANYITKPFNEDQLLVSVKVALNNSISEPAMLKPTDTERSILQLLGKGLSSKDIAEKFGNSQHTIDTHRRNMIKKFHVNNIPELICLATARGWVKY